MSIRPVALISIVALALVAAPVAQADERREAHSLAEVAKKKCKGKKKKKCKRKQATSSLPTIPIPVVPAPAPVAQPLPLTQAEAENAALDAAYYEYLIDPYADGWGIDGCIQVTTYRWDCLAWNHEDYPPPPPDGPYWCDWIETVVRTGINGVDSYRNSDFDCYPDT